ncbi:hypothetical protein FRX31_015418 [Thalictrum thalictroides]|uniref:Uncharacterized protein n=1 Tax=Thalictrum thalictroides TaxID=46969 RepID=A0A7J6WF08_THATH|nr:hypothetical protein FRX31_015418 [Thalictrum thalictroides]
MVKVVGQNNPTWEHEYNNVELSRSWHRLINRGVMKLIIRWTLALVVEMDQGGDPFRRKLDYSVQD